MSQLLSLSFVRNKNLQVVWRPKVLKDHCLVENLQNLQDISVRWAVPPDSREEGEKRKVEQQRRGRKRNEVKVRERKMREACTLLFNI